MVCWLESLALPLFIIMLLQMEGHARHEVDVWDKLKVGCAYWHHMPMPPGSGAHCSGAQVLSIVLLLSHVLHHANAVFV